jgi:hypothetical protein
MSIRFIGSVWDSGLYDGPRLLMMLALADHADDGGWSFPSYDTLALKIRRNTKTVYRILADLESEGAIRRQGGRICICEPAILEEVKRRAGTGKPKKSPQPVPVPDNNTLTSENGILNSENRVLITENENLKSENDNLKNETSFYIEPSLNRQTEPSSNPVAVLADHFRAKTSIEPPHESASSWRDNWQPTLSAILDRAGGDIERAKEVIDASLEFAWGRGNNAKGRTYPVASPHSLRTISVNQAATQQTAAAVADDDTLWQRAVAAVTRRDFTDERLKAAIRAIGGTGRIASANGHDTETLKRSLGHAYRNVAAA